MAHLIDKDALVAEIEKIRAKWFGINNDFANGQKGALTDVLSLIDTLEVKEDLEKEFSSEDYISFFEEHPNFPDDWGFDEAWVFAKYFFELGQKAQKGE